MKITSSGIKETLVPFLLEDSSNNSLLINLPCSNSAEADLLSLLDSTLKKEDNALTALVPTPFKPTDFLKALESYLPPVFILETTSTTLPNGIPLP